MHYLKMPLLRHSLSKPCLEGAVTTVGNASDNGRASAS